MSTFNTYQPEIPEPPLARKWFVVALVASLAIHATLFFVFSTTKLEHFTPYTERLVPRAFTSLGRVDVDPKLLDPEPEKPAEKQATTQQIANEAVPADKPSMDANPDEVVYKPSAPELLKPITNDKPKVDNANLQALEKLQQKASTDLNNELDSVRDQLIKDKPKISSTSLMKLSEAVKPGAQAGGSGIPGTKSLDDAISGTGGGLHSGDKIGIKGGALFEYDKSDLRPDAIKELGKLATIVKKYPDAVFTIDGYTDSFGSPAYNLDLSQRRANEVKAWLLANLEVNAFRIEAYGRGSTNFVVSPNGTVEQQENNRRVEIGLKFSH